MLKMDTKRFSFDVTKEMHRQNISVRELARKIESTPYYVDKAMNGELNDLYTYLALCEFINTSPDTYVIKEDHTRPANPIRRHRAAGHLKRAHRVP